MAEQDLAVAVSEPTSTNDGDGDPDAQAKSVWDDLVSKYPDAVPEADLPEEEVDVEGSGSAPVTNGEQQADGQTTSEADSTGAEPAKAEGSKVGKPEDNQETSDDVPDGFDEALAAMARDGVSEEQIQALYESDPKAFIEYGQKRAQVQKDVTQFGNEFRENREEFEQWKDGQGEKPESESSSTEAPKGSAVDQDVETVITEALSPLTDDDNFDLYGELAEPLKKGFMNLANSFKSRIDQQAEQIQQLRLDGVNNDINSTRRGLISDGYPQLAQDSAHDEVLKRYDTIVSSPDRSVNTVEEAYREAAKWTFSDTNFSDLKTKMLARSGAQKSGQPRAPHSLADKNATPEEIEEADFNRLYSQHYGNRKAAAF